MLTASSASRTCGARTSASLYTATVFTPSSWQARMTRRAISPRFAIRTLLNTSYLERDVSVLLRRILVAFGLKRLQRIDEGGPGVTWIDDVVEITASGGDVWMREHLAVFFDLGVCGCRLILALGDLFSKENLYRTLRSHHRNLSGRPRYVEVAADVFGAHDVVRSPICLACDHRELGHSGLAVGVQKLGAVLDYPAVLLRHARQEAGYILEGDERNVERIAEANEARCFERRIDVENTGQHRGLIRYNANAETA